MASCTDKFVILSRNCREIRYFGREIRHFDREIRDFGREITAKSTILQLRGTAKFGQRNRAKHRSLVSDPANPYDYELLMHSSCSVTRCHKCCWTK